MRIAQGPRPWTIWAFGACLLILALYNLFIGLDDWHAVARALSSIAPWFDWSREWAIVAVFSEFTIALIPLVWIVVFAASFARWFILFFGLIKLGWGGLALAIAWFFGDVEFSDVIQPALVATILILLWMPTSVNWLNKSNSNRAKLQ